MKLDSIDIKYMDSVETSIMPQYMIWIYPIIGVLCIGLTIWGIRKYRHSKYSHLKKVLKGKNQNQDFSDVINSAFHAKALYDELKGVCHPDKFATNPELCAKATEIFALLVKNKHDYNELLKLKKRIKFELNINL